MKLYEIYPRMNNKLTSEDLDDLEQPMTIKGVRIQGETKKSVWISFKESVLEHRCSKADVFVIANLLGVSDTEEFIGQQISLETDGNKVFVSSKKK